MNKYPQLILLKNRLECKNMFTDQSYGRFSLKNPEKHYSFALGNNFLTSWKCMVVKNENPNIKGISRRHDIDLLKKANIKGKEEREKIIKKGSRKLQIFKNKSKLEDIKLHHE